MFGLSGYSRSMGVIQNGGEYNKKKERDLCFACQKKKRERENNTIIIRKVKLISVFLDFGNGN